MYKKVVLLYFLLFSTSVKANWNIKFPTAGGKVLWTDIKVVNGWRIQKNIITGHCRLLNPKKIRYEWGTEKECTATLSAKTSLNSKKKTAVLIHGFGLRKESLNDLVPVLQKEGFQTVQFGYSALLEPLESSADKLHQVLKDYEGEVYVVTHSMGGILFRLYQQKYMTKIEKAVLLTAPNRGVELVDFLKKIKMAAILGVNGSRLHTDCDGLPQSLPSPACTYMTVAGTKKSIWGYFPLFFFSKENNDGLLNVSTTRLGDELYHLVVPAYHFRIMKNKSVQKSIINFFNEQP